MNSVLICLDDGPAMIESQHLLLQALLADAPEDEAAFERWVQDVDFDRLDFSSLRLIPALFKKFMDNPASAPYRGRMKGIYRYFHYRSSLLAADAYRTIEALLAANVELIAFKGLAIALHYHQDFSLRPMGDVDILIRRDDMEKAEGILLELGWAERYEPSSKPYVLHSHDFLNKNKNGFDLHWYAMQESSTEGIDEGIWQRAQTIRWRELSLRIMGPEDLVLTIMINGVREPENMYFGWIFDLVTILRSHPDFNWDLLWKEAGLRGIRHRIFSALSLLHQEQPELFSAQRLHQLFASDPALLHRCVRENRTACLDPASRSLINTQLDPRWHNRLLHHLKPDRSAYQRLVSDSATLKYMRYSVNSAGELDAFYVHGHALAWLPQLAQAVGIDSSALPDKPVLSGNEGWVRLKTPATPRIGEMPPDGHAASMDLLYPANNRINLKPAEFWEVRVRIQNNSPFCWVAVNRDTRLFGLSWHLLDDKGGMIDWDCPRLYFIKPDSRHLVYLPPGNHIHCSLKWRAPEQPGHYQLQLDIVHEHVVWFSQQGNEFPIITLHVNK